jgi:hypothetical protein
LFAITELTNLFNDQFSDIPSKKADLNSKTNVMDPGGMCTVYSIPLWHGIT